MASPDASLDAAFEPQSFEALARERWNQAQAFRADPAQEGEPFAVVIPPPNVTAALHLGHALNNTLQDIIVRARRMMGRNTLWMPGTDHAGIATQTVVEKRLIREENKRRKDFSREAFVERVQAWKDEYEAVILGQLEAMGCSCDFSRTRFTMDETCARAVREVFFKLFEDGLITRGLRLVNWDPATQTVLADDELEDETIETSFWYLRYPLAEPVGDGAERIDYVVVGTTRPETMLGDSAVAVNPNDPRAKLLAGREVILPIVNRRIPIVADDYVVLPDPESSDEKARYSSGFLKVTPAHDPNDWDIGQRHELPIINVMAPDASISPDFGFEDGAGTEAEAFYGMDRYEARKAIVAWFEAQGLLHEVRPYSHSVAHSYRSHVPVEPYLSRQWYVSVKQPIARLEASLGAGLLEGTDVPASSLAGLALAPRREGRVRFIPERYTRNYDGWLENLRDWPISRQLWWGHQIPVWSKEGHHEVNAPAEQARVLHTEEDGVALSYACIAPGCEALEASLESAGWRRDEDVLDTWFSSALWPFSTMGWPEKTPELGRYYPGHLLCTAREIITLWVSRMVMMGQYCLGDIPFPDVFIHAMILDGQGRKMSKTLGNGIDPLVVIDSHGADAMRYTLCAMTTQTQDVRMPVKQITLPDGRVVNSSDKFDIGRKLCVKVWNATRFVLQRLEGLPAFDAIDPKAHLSDRWILSRLSATVTECRAALEEYRFSELADGLYRFLFDDLCDWYVEVAKSRIDAGEEAPKAVLAFALDQFLRLFHPVAPFVTEALWVELGKVAPRRGPGDAEAEALLATAAFPQPREDRNEVAEARFEQLQELVRLARNARKANNIKPKRKVDAILDAPEADRGWMREAADVLVSQAGLGTLEVADASVEPSADMGVCARGEVKLLLKELVDKEAELKRLDKEKQRLSKGVKGIRGKLGNAGFTSNAPAEVIERERERLAQLERELEAVEAALAQLQ